MQIPELQRVAQRVAQPISASVITLVLLTLITVGAVFRTTHINHKVYWTDEVFTSLQVSGHLMAEVEQVLDGRVLTTDKLHRYQFPTPETGKSFRDTIKGLIAFEPQHTPIYFVSARFWLEWFGNSITTIRSMGAIVSLLTIPLMYWLCLELFQTPAIAWCGAALVAISPFHLLYAHEARPTVMWIALTVWSCAALLRAKRLNTHTTWMVYCLTLSLSLYTFLFSGFTIIAQGVYLAIAEKFKMTRTLWAYGFATFIASLSFLPWLLILVDKPPSNYASDPSPLLTYPKAWLRNLSAIFVDFNINDESTKVQILGGFILILLVAIIVSHAFYSLFKQQSQQPQLQSAFLMISCLMGIPSLILLLHDVITQGSVTTRTSYNVPSIIGLELLVAYWLHTQFLTTGRSFRWNSWLSWKNAAISLMAVSIFSCGVLIQSDHWWLKFTDNIYQQVAVEINQSKKPLVMSDDLVIRVLSLSHELKPETDYSLSVEPVRRDRWKPLKVPNGYSDVFLFKPSEQLLKGLNQKFVLKNIIPDVLWRVTRI